MQLWPAAAQILRHVRDHSNVITLPTSSRRRWASTISGKPVFCCSPSAISAAGQPQIQTNDISYWEDKTIFGRVNSIVIPLPATCHPPHPPRDVCMVYEIMDTDLHQIISSPQPLSGESGCCLAPGRPCADTTTCALVQWSGGIAVCSRHETECGIVYDVCLHARPLHMPSR